MNLALCKSLEKNGKITYSSLFGVHLRTKEGLGFISSLLATKQFTEDELSPFLGPILHGVQGQTLDLNRQTLTLLPPSFWLSFELLPLQSPLLFAAADPSSLHMKTELRRHIPFDVRFERASVQALENTFLSLNFPLPFQKNRTPIVGSTSWEPPLIKGSEVPLPLVRKKSNPRS